MNHELFLQQIEANPADRQLRLIYADWLEERGDIRSEYLRPMERLAGRTQTPDCQTRIFELRSEISRQWLLRIEQSFLMLTNPTTLASEWLMIDLGEYRPGTGTYDRYSSRKLPPLPLELLDGSYDWLRGCECKDPDWAVDWSERHSAHLAEVVALLSSAGTAPPDEYLSLLSQPDLVVRIRSCTGCEFVIAETLYRCDKLPGCILIPFLIDSQGVAFWFICVHESGSHCVVEGNHNFLIDDCRPLPGNDGLDLDWLEAEALEFGEYSDARFACANFEEFIYRFWIENEIWFNLYHKRPLTDGQRRYVEHYRGQQESSG